MDSRSDQINNEKYAENQYQLFQSLRKSDSKQAIFHLLNAAIKDHPKACFHLGILYLRGIFFAKDLVKAAEYFQRAIEYGDKKAPFELGLMHLRGNGLEVNFKKAADYFQIGADRKHPKAQFELGCLLCKGKGVIQDKEKGLKLVKEAADHNYDHAQYDFACSNFRRNQFDVAVIYFEKAANNGYKKAKAKLKSAKIQLGLDYLMHNVSDEKIKEGLDHLLDCAEEKKASQLLNMPENLQKLYQYGGKRYLKYAADQGYLDALEKLKKLDITAEEESLSEKLDSSFKDINELIEYLVGNTNPNERFKFIFKRESRYRLSIQLLPCDNNLNSKNPFYFIADLKKLFTQYLNLQKLKLGEDYDFELNANKLDILASESRLGEIGDLLKDLGKNYWNPQQFSYSNVLLFKPASKNNSNDMLNIEDNRKIECVMQ